MHASQKYPSLFVQLPAAISMLRMWVILSRNAIVASFRFPCEDIRMFLASWNARGTEWNEMKWIDQSVHLCRYALCFWFLSVSTWTGICIDGVCTIIWKHKIPDFWLIWGFRCPVYLSQDCNMLISFKLSMKKISSLFWIKSLVSIHCTFDVSDFQ